MPADVLTLRILSALLLLALGSLALSALSRLMLRTYGRTWRDVYRALRVRTNRFKLTEKARIREDLLRDREVQESMLEHARETGESLADAERRVRGYLEEIIPAFDLVSYYRVGLPIARLALGFFYKLVAWKDELPDPKRLHADHAVVYIFNHRSNADFIFAAFALTDRVALSYAVGEWARVWPLEALFKSFGSYFVRRGYKEKLYHQVLRRYVQLITRRGVPQGIFLEGGLSRDGWFRPAKVGLLDHILQCAKDPEFGKDILFVPGCLNYDRVLEDRALTAEAKGRKPERSIMRMFKRTLRIVFRGSLKLALRRTRKHGYAALRLGRPVSFRAWVEKEGRAILDGSREERQKHVQRFGDALMADVARLMPVPCVPLLALALASEAEAVTRDELVARVGALRKDLEAAGARVVRADKTDGEIVDYAALLLETRGTLVRLRDGRFLPNEADRDIFRYYAGSIAHLVACQWPKREAAVDEAVPTPTSSRPRAPGSA